MAARANTAAGTARRALVATGVAVVVVVAAIALWKLRVLIALLFLGFIVAAAMRPGVEALAQRRVPRIVGVLLHYACLSGILAVVLWFVVPTALTQVQDALGDVPTTRSELREAVRTSTGFKHDVLLSVERRLDRTPTIDGLLHPALDITRTALEVVVGIFFVLAVGAYWIFERDRAERVVLALVPRSKRRIVRQTWRLVDFKLGSYVRGVILLVVFVSTVLSIAFWQIGLPYWLLLGVFAGLVEIVPVIGPLAAGAVAVGVGLTVSWQTAALAAAAVYGLRVVQDYIINPRVLGHAVGLTPLVVLVSVAAVGLLFGPAWVPLATPFAAVIATLVDVFVRGQDPAQEDVPAILFAGQEVEPASRGKRAAT